MVSATLEIAHHVAFYVRHSSDCVMWILIMSSVWVGIAFEGKRPPADRHDALGVISLFAIYINSLAAVSFLLRCYDQFFFFIFYLVIVVIALPLAVLFDVLSFFLLLAYFTTVTVYSILAHAFLVLYFWAYSITLTVNQIVHHWVLVLLKVCWELCIARKPRYRQAMSNAAGLGGTLSGTNLCLMCDQLISNSPLLVGTNWIFTRNVEFHGHHNLLHLRASAGTCHLCNFFLRSKLLVTQRGSAKPSQEETINNLNDPYRIKVWEKRLSSGKKLLRFQLVGKNNDTGVPLIVEEFHHATPDQGAPKSTDSASILEWARREVKSCEKNHENCQNFFVRSEQTRFRPKRLLDVGDSTNVRLVETSELSAAETVEYVALSHCWGKNGISHILKVENLADLKTSIEVTQLAKNFQHAISITRGMSVRYLWIDSLCIIQNSIEDLQCETDTMGLLYANALCTISATSSPDSSGGLFFPTEPFLGDCSLRCQGSMSLIATFPGTQETALAELFHQRVDRPEPGIASLTTRGWAFQERVLASRVLHFCNGVVLFECNTLQASSSQRYATPYPRLKHIRSDGVLQQATLGPKPHPRPARPPWPTPKFDTGHRRSMMLTHSTKIRPGRYLDMRYRVVSSGDETVPVYRWNKDYERHSYSAANFYSLSIGYGEYKKYMEWRPQLATVVDMSARLGMRGAFEMLVNFKGHTLPEFLEFHTSWFEIVGRYSMRELTVSEDKLRALGGITFFVERCTGFKYTFGAWNEVLGFDLLWVRKGGVRERPERSVPSWSWAAIDGEVGHRLKRESNKQGGSGKGRAWDDINVLVENMSITTKNAVLLPTCRFWALYAITANVNFVPDIELETSYHELICVPIVKLRISDKQCELQGLVLRSWSGQSRDADFQRVGYFWTSNTADIQTLLRDSVVWQKLRIG